MIEKPRRQKKTAASKPVETAIVLRTCPANMVSHNGFIWPESGPVSAPDWKPTRECGNGLHGLLWGEGDGSLLSCSDDTKWLLVEIDRTEAIDLEGKVKFPSGVVVFCGDKQSAISELVARGGRPDRIVYGQATAGDRGTATAGHYGTAVAGDRGTATAGDYGTAVAGDRGTATAGDEGTATAGYRGTATAGHYGTAVAGHRGTATAGDRGTATAGDDGIIAVAYWDRNKRRLRIKIGYVGEDGLKPNVAYRLDEFNNFVCVKAST